MAESRERNETIWERRVTVILIALLLGVGGWTALGVHSQASLVARIEERLDGLSTQLNDVKRSMGDQYTKSDASRDLSIRDRQIEDLRERVRRLERQP